METFEYPRIRAVALSVVIALCTLGIGIHLVGAESISQAISSVSTTLLGMIILISLGWLAAWSLSFRSILETLDVQDLGLKTGLVFLMTMFADYLTPSAQAGSVPIGGLLVSRATGVGYTTGMTAVATFGILNIVPSMVMIAASATYLALTTTLDPELKFAVLLLLSLMTGLGLVGLIGWRYRYRLGTVVIPLLAAFIRQVNRLLPTSYSIDPRLIDRYTGNITKKIERIGWNRQQLIDSLCFSALGWLILSAVFWASLYSVGNSVPVAVPLLVVPLSMTGNVLPLPGGVGGVEALLVALTIGTASISIPSATAAVLIYRVMTFGLALLLGGLATALLEFHIRNPSLEDSL